MDSSNQPDLSYLRILPDCVECFHVYQGEIERNLEKEKMLGQDFHEFYISLVSRLYSNLLIDSDPNFIFEKLKQDSVANKADHNHFIYTNIQSIQQFFYSNQEIRSSNVSIKINEKKLLTPSCNLQNQELILSFLDSQQKPKPGLYNLVDSNLCPIYSTYLHLYEPRYFPISHKSINSLYLSNTIQSIIANGELCSKAFLKSELKNTKKMLDDLISFSVRAKTEYDFFSHARSFPPTHVVKKSQIYREKQSLYGSLKNFFFSDFRNFVKGINKLSRAALQTAITSETMIRKYTDVKEKFCIVNGRVRSLSNQYKTLVYFQSVCSNQENIASSRFGPLAQPIAVLFKPLLKWDLEQRATLNVILENFEYPNPQSIEMQLCKLNLTKQKLDNALLVIRQNEEMKKREKIQKIRDFNIFKAAKLKGKQEVCHNDKEKFIERISDAFSNNLERKNIQEEMTAKISSLLCSIATICDSKPIIESIDYLAGNEEAEIKQRIKECDALKALRDRKLAEIKEVQMYIGQCKKDLENINNNPGESQTSVDSEPTVGTDERYTEARLYVSCMNCDALSNYFVVSCNHKICQKCFEKAKKKKVSFCPVCEQVVQSFIKLNW